MRRNIEVNDEKLLSIVIAGQPELSALLRDQSLRQLKQRIALRCELRPFSLHESGAYISARITAAGGVPAAMFTREAVTLIHESSRGIPRTINVIADNALLGGFAKGQRLVTCDLVREVCRDFDIGPPLQSRPEATTPRESAPAIPPQTAKPSTTAEQRGVDAPVPAPPRGFAKTAVPSSAAFNVLGLK